MKKTKRRWGHVKRYVVTAYYVETSDLSWRSRASRRSAERVVRYFRQACPDEEIVVERVIVTPGNSKEPLHTYWYIAPHETTWRRHSVLR